VQQLAAQEAALVCRIAALGVLAVLQEHPELPCPQHLQAALCAAVRADVRAGSGSILEAAEKLAAKGQVSMPDLYWAAVEEAATAAAAKSKFRSKREVLLAYWSTAALSSAEAIPSSTAAAVVAAMAADAAGGSGGLTQQLLAQPLSAAVLGALLQAAQVSDTEGAVLPQLLQYALQNQQVQLLPAAALPQLLQSALAAAAAAPTGAVSFGDCLQLLDLVLQQQDEAASVNAATAQLLLAATKSSTAHQQQFVGLMRQHSSSPAVSALLCGMLQAACEVEDTESSWQLFQMLQECSKPSEQQLQACSTLLVLQSSCNAAAAAANASIMSVWQDCCAAAGSSSAAIQQLAPAAQQAVVSALAAEGQSEQALLLTQNAPALLPYLAQLWLEQQQQPGSTVDAAVLLHALQVCVAVSGPEAAEAADTLAGLLLQQGTAGNLLEPALTVQLVQLLCLHSRAATALQLLPACLAAAGAVAAAAIADTAGAVAKGGESQQQVELLQLLVNNAKQGDVQVALSQALAQPAPKAVGLLLRVLQDSSSGVSLGQLLAPGQLEQLCSLVCSSSSSSSSSSSLTALPNVQQFALDCLSAEQLSGSVAAQLLNALCSQHPELQLAAAAGHLSLEAAAQNTTDRPQGGLPDLREDTQQLVGLLADLCYSQTSSTSQGGDLDALEVSYADWASAVSPEAAAAALSAAWLYKGRSPA
jgi:hypothetical protein